LAASEITRDALTSKIDKVDSEIKSFTEKRKALYLEYKSHKPASMSVIVQGRHEEYRDLVVGVMGGEYIYLRDNGTIESAGFIDVEIKRTNKHISIRQGNGFDKKFYIYEISSDGKKAFDKWKASDGGKALTNEISTIDSTIEELKKVKKTLRSNY